jgi:GH18 family chitinase
MSSRIEHNRWLALTLVMLACAVPGTVRGDDAPKGFQVVGYLPDYRIGTFDPALAAKVTDIVVFSIETTECGDLKLGRWNASAIGKVQAMKEKYGVRLLISVGGWGRSGGFPALAAAPEARKAFADSLIRFCKENRFDGVDLDWEHPKGDRQEADFGTLLSTLKGALAPEKLSLSIAAAGWQRLTPEVVEAVDFIHLMAYDGGGRHSTYEFAVEDVEKLKRQGVPAAKTLLGLPFYGRDVKSRSESTYAQIFANHHPAPDANEVDGVYFNGAAMIERKTRFARRNHLGGVMIWEIGQDVPGEASLLEAIHRGMTR